MLLACIALHQASLRLGEDRQALAVLQHCTRQKQVLDKQPRINRHSDKQQTSSRQTADKQMTDSRQAADKQQTNCRQAADKQQKNSRQAADKQQTSR